MAQPIYFQWQNEILCKDIYPMRETKLRDFLVFFKEIDLWKEYKDKKDLSRDIAEYTQAQKTAAAAAYKEYTSKREYFMQPDVRAQYLSFKPLDEAELAEINRMHGIFISSWPKDIRGERYFMQTRIQSWTDHRNQLRDRIKSRQRRQAAMDPNHPRYAPEKQELDLWEKVSLPMAEQEFDRLREFLDTDDLVEKRKLEWYWMEKRGQAPAGMTEEQFLTQYNPKSAPTNRNIAAWKAQEYEKSLEKKNQYELLEEIRQRFVKEPKRYPYWLQYMVVHFSGMRYKSAHGSWADPADLLARLRVSKIEEEVKALDDAAIAKICQDKIAAYAGQGGGPKPLLATATEKAWKQKVGWYMPNLKSPNPSTRRRGLTDLRKAEDEYETKSKPTQEVLDTLMSMKGQFPAWAWKMIVELTPLRLTEVTAPGWESLTPEEEQESYKRENYPLRAILNAWITAHTTAWREQHGRSHELIVSRVVCNEAAEHIQHVRGHLPPGGLTAKPTWYRKNEDEKKIAGAPAPYYVKATSAEQYTPGASVLWLRFVDKQPDQWQIAKAVETKDKVGLLPDAFMGKSGGEKGGRPGRGDIGGAKKASTNWTYRVGDIITRERFLVGEGKGVQKQSKAKQVQWLRWIHEATVAEVAETADGPTVITFETALPDDDKGTSSVGIFKKPLRYFLSDFMVAGNEDSYNRSFVGYVPEGPLPMEHLNQMLDWNKILRR
jgi:cation transport regulator ChaB